MSINLYNLEIELSKKLNQSSLSADEILLYTNAVASLKSGIVYTVNSFNQLPSISDIDLSAVYYVEDEKILYSYFLSENIWSPIVETSLLLVSNWGIGSSGQLGTFTTASRSSPVVVVGGFNNWCRVGTGICHTVAIRTDGTLWAWGLGTLGQLGDNSVVNKSNPVPVVGGFTDWCQVSGGCIHTAAVRTNGTLWAWGWGTSGQLGSCNAISQSSPVSVVGGFTNWCQVSAGGAHTVAVRTNGTVWTWGANSSGRLGDGTIINRSSPVQIVGGFTDWCQVSAGLCFTTALRSNGTIWTWGLGSWSQLGNGLTVSQSSPVSVIGGFTDWCQVSAGFCHAAAIRTNGTLWSWGTGLCGQLGTGFSTGCASPVSVVGGFTDWCQVSAGGNNSAAVRTNGTLWAWGCGTSGQLGNGTTLNRSSPVSVVGGATGWCQVSAGGFHTAAIRSRIL